MQKKHNIKLLIPFFFLTACFENEKLTKPQVVTDGEDLALQIIEYTDIDLFTYFNDSLATNNLSSFTLGHHEDNYRGSIHAMPYLQFGITNQTAVNEDAQLDSVVLVLFYEKYHYDTLPGFDIEVHELLENLETDDDGNIYSYQNFEFDQSPLITQPSRIVPSKDSLTVTLPYDFGHRLFEMGKGNNSIFESNDELEEIFKGLVLSTNENSALMGFNNSSYIGFHYRVPSDLDEGKGLLKLSVANGSGKFTHFDIDRTSQYFTSPQAYENIPIATSNGVIMTDQIMGAAIRLELPEILELKEKAEAFIIASANLILPLQPNTYDRYFNIPVTTVNLGIVNKKNLLIQSLGTTTLSSWDEQFQEKTFYEIPIKSFIDYKLSKGQHNEDALWINVPNSTDLETSGLILSESTNEQKIKIDITFIPLN
ncbi:DUF4270 domain-containing protein [Echinicola marina]|uniref:DUF4270 family protein n=1 Tax=Echinicola marina TaxID=2859768 RepID=UPI001CF67091|nr:DUF4270 family protein [Echinicola marina]UCS95482.1 DUF4270 domain-containing protein [Echinicola marina]